MENVIKIKELIKTLNYCSEFYYNGRLSPLTDKQWDLKFDELKQLENKTNIIFSNSPTQKVGSEIISKLNKVRHNTPMLSLQKTKDISELKRFLGNKEGILSDKLDGLTTVLTYNNGTLQQAVTRGNGEIGLDVTHHVKMFQNIPQSIPYKGKLVVRGESIIKLNDFKDININNEYANARNLASGTLNQLDNTTTKKRKMSFISFGITEYDYKFATISEQFEWLNTNGFDVVPYGIVTKDNIEFYVDKLTKKIQNDGIFPCDGLVLEFNDIEYGESLGYTSHHPLNAIAYKWQDNTKETILRDIKFKVGKTGIVTPVAYFDKVELEGTFVEKANLHNISILKSLELGIGDTITVYKANMIIPQIDENLSRSNTFEIPLKCPICSKDLIMIKPNDAEFLYCDNPDCNGKLSQKIKHFCSKEAVNIEGLSIKTIEAFIDNGIINSILDIYKLDDLNRKEQILKLSKFGIKKYNNLIESINNSRKCKLENLIFSLGIDNVGKSSSKDLVKHFRKDNNDSIEILNSIRKAGINELIKVKDFGDITSQSIYNWFRNEDNNKLIDNLLLEIKLVDETIADNEDNNGVFKDCKICCTGSFACGKKDYLKELIESNGGTFATGYTKSLTYLVEGSLKSSSKVQKAINDGVTVLKEDEFLKMIN